MNSKTKKLVLNSALAAICIVLGVTPIGYIPIGPVQITLLCLPVAVGTLTLGLRSGLFLGFIFGATIFFQMLAAPTAVITVLMSDSLFWVKMPLIIFIPRLLVPIATYLVYKAMSKSDKHNYLSLTVSSVAASLTNTVFFLGMLLALFINISAVNLAFVGSLVLTNGIPEAIFMGIICPPIVRALKHIQI
ncbi:MAG: ECF transporter S component [Eubacteriales bacterium]